MLSAMADPNDASSLLDIPFVAILCLGRPRSLRDEFNIISAFTRHPEGRVGKGESTGCRPNISASVARYEYNDVR